MQKIKKTTIDSTPFGPIALIWKSYNGQPQLLKIILAKPGLPADQEAERLFPGIRHASTPAVELILTEIVAGMAGEKIEFTSGFLQIDNCSNFQKKVLRALPTIFRGMVCSYGNLAAFLGHSQASRAVGTALATNPFPILIPCHRIIRSDRSLGGFAGGLQMKRALLEAEGVRFDRAGRVCKNSILTLLF
ncbi:MAG: MGMT family protein [Deltaproteobacteria bacterium]|nr:MGMT family protein [Deltaproteobacteria bacterium]